MKRPKTPNLDKEYYKVITEKSKLIDDLVFEIERCKEKISLLNYAILTIGHEEKDQKREISHILWNCSSAMTAFKYKDNG